MDEHSEVTPFRIDIPQADLDDLRDRLARTRWPDQLPGVGWDYGIPLDYVRELASYWRDGYDWRVHEARLNGFGQFVTTIDGARVHFLHIRSAVPDAMPLIITHGWPGSVVEFWDIIGPLTDPAAFGGSRATRFIWSSRPFPATVLRADPGPGLGRAPGGAGLGHADVTSGLPAVRGTGRRLGVGHLPGTRPGRP